MLRSLVGSEMCIRDSPTHSCERSFDHSCERSFGLRYDLLCVEWDVKPYTLLTPVNDPSICRSVGPCPVQCGKRLVRCRLASDEILGARDFVLAASAIRRSDGSRDEAGSVVCGSVGYFWQRILARHCMQRRLHGVRVRQCLNRLSCGLGWCVRWAEALLY